MRSQWRVAAGVAAVLVAATLATVGLAPRTWHVDVALLAQRAPMMAIIGNPRRTVPPEADAPTRSASEAVLSHTNLAAMVAELDLVRAWDDTRSPLLRVRDAIAALVRHPRTRDEKAEALVYLLQERLYVVAGPIAVSIGVDWPDAATAQRIVEAAYRKFIDLRRDQEQSVIAETVAILDRHVAEASQLTEAAFDTLREAAPTPTPPDGHALGAAARKERHRRGVAAPADPEIARLRAALSARRAELATALAVRQDELAAAESRLAELKTVYADHHPEVLSARQALAGLRRDSAGALALRAQIARMDRELASRIASWRSARAAARSAAAARAHGANAAPLAAAPEPDSAAPAARYARERLRLAADLDARLMERTRDARIERDVASAAFKYRYFVLRAPLLPRGPVKPQPLLVVVGGVLCALALAVLAAVLVERTLRRAPAGRRRAVVVVAWTIGLGLATLFTLACVAVPAAEGAPPRWPDSAAWALAPGAVALIGWAILKSPLRSTALVLVFLMLALEQRGSADGLWMSPWAPAGFLLNSNLNLSIPLKALRFSGLDVIMVTLISVIVWRKLTGARIDRSPDTVSTPQPFHVAAIVSLGSLLFLIAYGLARGGDFTQMLWQTRYFALLPLLFFVLSVAIRGPQDLPGIGKLVVAAALVKAVLAIYVRYVALADEPKLTMATSHGDSMLFATALCIMAAFFLERPTRRVQLGCALTLPVIALGIKANERRLAWVELAIVLITMFVLLRRTRLKRSLKRAAAVALPVFALYVAAGWNATESRVFGPAVKVRSILDSKYDRSTEERDVENYNLMRNFFDRPIIGAGFGHEYVFYVEPDDISGIFPQWRFIPHNSVLGLLAFSGVVGFTGLWMLLTVTVFMAARSYRLARDGLHRAAALSAIGAVLIYLIQCYGDMGFQEFHGVFLVACAAVVAAKLGVTTGAWPSPRPPRRPARAVGNARPWRPSAAAHRHGEAGA